MSNPLICLMARVTRGDFTLDIDLRVSSRVLGIVGPSGSGKSTLVSIAAGLIKPECGELRFQGEVWTSTEARQELPANRRGIGLVPQDGLLFPHLDVRGNLVAGRHSKTRPTLNAVEEMANRLGIADILERPTTSLSGGQRQRVALGRALLSNPRWLLLDEPLGALDYARRRSLLPLLRSIVETTNLPLWFVSHDYAEVMALCDEVITLEHGKVIAQGKPGSLPIDSALGATLGGRYENLLRAVVETANDDISVVSIGSRTQFFTRAAALESGQVVFVSLFADDIMIALECPSRLSARNVLPARITHLPTPGSAFVTVQLDDGTSLWVQLAASTIVQLGLREGAEIFTVFKASSCRIWSDSSEVQAERNHP